MHSGLNPAWHFWLSTRFSCCLKMKSVENILGYIREQQIFEIVQENTIKCSKLIHFRQQKIEFKPECLVWSCNRMFCCIFGWYFYVKSGWNMKKILLSSSRAFSLSTPTFSLSTLWTTVRLHGKKLQNATNLYYHLLVHCNVQSASINILWSARICFQKAFD